LNPAFKSLLNLSVGSLAVTNPSNAGDQFTASNYFSNIKPEPAERRVLLFDVQSRRADNGAMRHLDKAAHIANILALVPAGFCAYVSFVLLHSQQPVSSAVSDIPNNKLVWLAVGAFFGLFTLGAVLSIVALLRKNHAVTVPIAESPKNEVNSQELENLAAHSAALNRELATVNEKLKECEQKRQMPRPYLEVRDTTESVPNKTPFVFTNRGGDVAHKIQVQPISINHRTVTFDPIEVIAVGEGNSTLPTAVGLGVLQEHDILHLMVSEWDQAFRAVTLGGLDVGEWPKRLTITYQDFTGKQFEATADLIVFPIANTLRDKHGDSKHEHKTVEVRNIKFKAVGEQS
jgi:hypothetical protein